ncbi:hypothetical protein JX266_007143 [Neoarthrinium moseri]|nr:hypothetical protein JX266_007143 [Neoarthrinium moseri]
MGCCFSTPAGPNAPYPGGAPSGSSRAINSPRLQASATEESGTRSPAVVQSDPTASLASPTSASSRRSRSQQPLDQHIDKPLRRHVWCSSDRTWTRAQLDKERTEFFDTRVTGRAEVWQTVHAALEVMWQSDAEPGATTEGDPEGDTALATAQSILRAAEITLPTGDLAKGVYDSLGHYYPLPEWIVTDPVNISETDEQDRAEDQKGGHVDDDGGAGEESDEVLRKREEKGKAVESQNTVKIRARLSETARDIIVKIDPDDSVRSVAQKILYQSRLDAQSRKIKLVYLGKILKENASLESQGFNTTHVVNAFVFSR